MINLSVILFSLLIGILGTPTPAMAVHGGRHDLPLAVAVTPEQAADVLANVRRLPEFATLPNVAILLLAAGWLALIRRQRG